MSSRMSISSLHTITTIAVIVVGLMFHELYKATGIEFLGIISPVNESKWEHWKIAFFPMLIIGTFEYLYLRPVKTLYLFPLVLGIGAFILVTFGGIELYELFFGESHLPIHMLTFIMGAIGGQFIRYRLMEILEVKALYTVIAWIILVLSILVFVKFTYGPPRADYFKDSLTDTYGIYKERDDEIIK